MKVHFTFDQFLGKALQDGSSQPNEDAQANMNTAIQTKKTEGYRVINDYEHPAVGRVVELEN
jgi:hypothetical protein